MVAPRYRLCRMLVRTASINVDCRKTEWLECFISCIIGCHTPARVEKEDEESRSEPHGTPKHNSVLCSRIAHYSTARNRHVWRDTTDSIVRPSLIELSPGQRTVSEYNSKEVWARRLNLRRVRENRSGKRTCCNSGEPRRASKSHTSTKFTSTLDRMEQ